MAKGLRSSTEKTNKSKLRSRVFGPVEDARTERLSTKLLRLASEPKAARDPDTKMDVEQAAGTDQHTGKHGEASPVEDMEVDQSSTSKSSSGKSGKNKDRGRIQKKRRGKATSLIGFPSKKQGNKRGRVKGSK